ncbi:MAG: hypothetical protein ACRCU2_30165, partial [Planktothrix sp.]
MARLSTSGFSKLKSTIIINNSQTQPQPSLTMNDAYLKLLLKILTAIDDNKGNPKAVYPLLEENSDQLDQTFILTLQEWA